MSIEYRSLNTISIYYNILLYSYKWHTKYYIVYVNKNCNFKAIKMSNVSITSTKREDREKQYAERMQELESVRALNSCLSFYLEHLRVFRKNLIETNKNIEELNKVNRQWDDLIKISKQRS